MFAVYQNVIVEAFAWNKARFWIQIAATVEAKVEILHVVAARLLGSWS